MRALLQRVSSARVIVDSQIVGAIHRGILVFIGFGKTDHEDKLDSMLRKILELRIFQDTQGKMNLSLQDIKGELLLVSQFTLYGNCSKGRRPGFDEALEPDAAAALFNILVLKARATGIPVATGIFAAEMSIELWNEGPVTLMLEK